MKFCKTCGGQLKENQRICAKCGTKVKSSTNVGINVNLDSEKVQESLNQGKDLVAKSAVKAKDTFSSTTSKIKEIAEEKNIKEKSIEFLKSKYFKISIAAIIVLFISIGGFTLYSKKANSASAFVPKFEQALKNKDYATLSEMIVFQDVVTEDKLIPFIDYMAKNEEVYKNFINTLNDQAAILDSDESIFRAYDESYSSLFSLQRAISSNAKYPFSCYFYDNSITVYLPNNSCTIYLNDKELKDLTFEDNGALILKNLLPAEYTVKAVYKNDLLNIEDSLTVNLYLDQHPYFELMKDKFETVKLYTNVDNATLLVNGKEVKDFTSNDTFGPVVEGMKLQAIVKEGGKEFKSNEVVWNGMQGIHLNFDAAMKNDPIFKNDEDIKEEVTALLGNYLRDFASAVNRNSYSYISSYIMPNSPLETQQKSTIKSLYEQEIKESFVDFELLDLSINEDKSELIATVYEVYDITIDKNTKTDTFNTKYSIKYNSNNNKYKLNEYLPVE